MSAQDPKVILLGPQASGKGTQAHILSTWSGAPKLVMGDLLRAIQNEDSERGKTVKELISKGELVPDDIILDLVKEWIKKQKDGWIIDGFPRTMEQARRSWEFLDPDAVFFLNLPDEEAKKRISYRRVCTKCGTNFNLITNPPKKAQGHCDVCGGDLEQREDDAPEIVEQRLRSYHEETEPVRDFYLEKGVLLEIDAKADIPKVAHAIQSHLEERQGEVRKKRGWVRWLVAGIVLAGVIIAVLAYIGSLQS